MASQKLNSAVVGNRTTAFGTAFRSTAGYQRRKFASAETISAPSPASSGTTAAEGSAGGAKGGEKKGFVEWYEGHLGARPVPTKMITGSILWGVGDAVAQIAPVLSSSEINADADDNAVAQTGFEYDFPRSARAVAFGFAIHAPLAHLHYNFLEWMTVRAGFEGLSIPVFKTIMEQFVYWSWVSNSLYHGAMGAMQGMGLTQIYDRVADVLWDTQVAQWAFWIPVQLLNFRFVPVRHQLNVVLLTSIAWTALLSAWYPPEEEGEDQAKEESKNATYE